MIGKSFVDKKYEELLALNAESTDALDVVTRTINRLNTINDKISAVESEIEDAKQKLTDTTNGLRQTKERNMKIMDKFKELIGE